MRRAAQFLGFLERRLGSGLLAVVLAVAITAGLVGVGVGASYEAAKGSSGTDVSSQADGAPATAVALKLVAGKHGWPRRGGGTYYRRIARRYVPPKGAAAFLPLYREAERVYGVNWRLLASVHRQETAFSKAPSTYRGLNDFGCCAGPMQFNVTNGPVSTWKRYRQSFRDGRRPRHYPHRTRRHPSIYDDFDAIMAAGSLLSDSGAGPALDGSAWQAAYSYYGHDLYGITYASQVVARAVAWERHGFCPNCPPDEALVAEFEEAYGTAARLELVGPEPRAKKKRKRARDRKGKRHKRAKRRDRGSDRRRARRAPADRKRRAKRRGLGNTKPSPPRRRRPTQGKPLPPPPTSTQPSTTPAPPPAPPTECPPIRKLLGCK